MILFFLYLAVLTYFLFFSEKYGRTAEREFSYNLTPFLEIRRFWNYREFLGLKAVFHQSGRKCSGLCAVRGDPAGDQPKDAGAFSG